MKEFANELKNAHTIDDAFFNKLSQKGNLFSVIP